ncbi:MAG: DUF3990 domain-containing protein [Lachnospiraceae bacterium]|nr:DUF3990 domain-containing protein [Lachnospiraceae bacterium]
MRLYHGSAVIVRKPSYGTGKPYNDYGRGFYCTEDIDRAREWAVDKERDGYVNCYEIDFTGLNLLDLNSDDYCILHWITLLLQNRRIELESPLATEAYHYLCSRYSLDMSGVDAVKGYRADDSYFSYAQNFVNGQMSVPQLAKALKLGQLGQQIMIRSRKAFGALSFVSSESVCASEWYLQKKFRDSAAREAYRKMNKTDYRRGELYMMHIIDEEVGPDDPRLQ